MMKKLLALIFIGLLLGPIVTALIDPDFGVPENRIGLKAPRIYPRAILDTRYYRAFDQYYNDRFSLGSPLVYAKRWADYTIFRMTDSPAIHIGNQGWLYTRRSIEDLRKDACDRKDDAAQMALQLYALEKIIEATGRRFFFLVVPNKSSIYPEFAGYVPRDNSCNHSRYDLLIDAIAELPFNNFIRFDRVLKQARSSQALLYDKTGAYWNPMGAMLAAEALQRQIAEDPRKEVVVEYTSVAGLNSDNLKLQLMGFKNTTVDKPVSKYLGNGQSDYPIGIVYGDKCMPELLPYLQQMFTRFDLIRAHRLPSKQLGEDLRKYEVILLVTNESNLDELEIDVAGLLAMFENDVPIAGRHSVDLQSAKAVSGISLKLDKSGLEIKSVGSTSVFELQSLPASDEKIFKLLKLSIEAPHPDKMTIRYLTDYPHEFENTLKKGLSRIYLPLPVEKPASIQFRPGNRPGVFRLRSAEIIEFSGNPDGEDQHQPWRVVADTDLEEDLPEPKTEPVAELASVTKTVSITVTDFADGRIFQRTGRGADIVVSGSYTGRPGSIEARVVRDRTHDAIVTWTVIDASPQNGIYVGVIPNVPQGGWYNIQVRSSENRDILTGSTRRWGIGILVACLGQSNMKEWFHTGSDLRSDALLRKYNGSTWSTLGNKGNAAIAFGNRITERLGIPVGLLDFAVNGSGLRKEADWGTGYWEDTARRSIYSQFVAGMETVGGVVEFVVWIQGEADAARGTVTEAEYRSSLENFISKQVRADIENGSQQQHLPFLVVAMVKRPGGKDGPHQAIRSAQYRVTEKIADCYLAATTLDLKNQGRQHLADRAYLIMGYRVAQTVLFVLGEETYHRGPTIVGATQIDSRTIDVRIEHRGGTDFSPDSEMTGWEVLADGRSLQLSRVLRHDPQTIRIELQRPVVQKTLVRYLHGAMPDTIRPVVDNSAMSLPLEEGQSEVN